MEACKYVGLGGCKHQNRGSPEAADVRSYVGQSMCVACGQGTIATICNGSFREFKFKIFKASCLTSNISCGIKEQFV